MKKNILSILISLVLLVIAGGCCAFAEEARQVAWVNPMYEDLAPSLNRQPRKPFTLTQSGAAETEEEFVGMIRQNMIKRNEYFTLTFIDDKERDEAYFTDLIFQAMEHTGVSNEGDYIRWHLYEVFYPILSPTEEENGLYTYRVNYCFIFLTTFAQEQTVTRKVEATLEELDLEGKSDYEKAAEIYNYICKTVTYDYTNYNKYQNGASDTDYKTFSAYGAVNGSAVCQGISQLMYRMLLEEGIDCRLIAGMANYRDLRENHAWNIIKIGNEYFDADATWDLGATEIEYCNYFLQTDEVFERNDTVHQRGADATLGEDYASSGFYDEYPMGTGAPLKAYHSGACRIEAISLLKDGTVGIEIRIGAEAYEGDAGAYAEIGGKIYPLSSAVTVTGSEGDVIKSFVIRKAPKEMQDAVAVTLCDGEGETVTLYDQERNDVTDDGYVTRVYKGIAEEADHGDRQFASVMNDLGASAQVVLGYQADSAAPSVGSLSGITAAMLADYAESTAGALPSGLRYEGMTLILDETTTVNYLFSGNVEGVSFFVDGSPAEAHENGDYYVVAIPGQKAQDLGTWHEITASDKESTFTISACALSYAYKAVAANEDQALQDLAKCLYAWYGLCA